MGLAGPAVLEEAAWAFCSLSHGLRLHKLQRNWDPNRDAQHKESGRGGRCASRYLGEEGPWGSLPKGGTAIQEVALPLLAHVEGWRDALSEMESIRTAALAATITDTEDNVTEPPRGSPGGPALPPEERLFIIWDSQDACCAVVARVLQHEYGALCIFIELHDQGVLSAALEQRPGVPRHIVCRFGGISAVLPSGICISECERYPKVLLYELRYLATLRLPNQEEVTDCDCRWFAPLRSMRDIAATEACAHRGGSTGDKSWWTHEQALRLISGSLEANKFAIVDGFLPEEDLMELQDAVRSLYDNGSMISGLSEQASTHGGFWGPDNDGDYMNQAGEARKWTLHGDFRAWCSDEDRRWGTAFQKHTRYLDRLVNLLKNDAAGEETSKQMRNVDFREYIMAVCYPGETRSRYLRHCDVSRGAVLTTILYLNPDWQVEDEGCLRLYWPGEKAGQRVKQDILPVAGRLLLFWASEEVPHEVLATKRDRFTISIWYKTGKDALTGPNWLPDLLLRHQPVFPLTISEALRRTGAKEALIKHVEWLSGLLAQQSGEQDKVAVLRSVLQSGSVLEVVSASLQGMCTQCGQAADGRLGTDEYAGQFFCTQCWYSWLVALASRPPGSAAPGTC